MPEADAPGLSPPLATAAAGGTAAPAPKRRKLRKGTVSCWECKRRKTRCTYASSTAAICDGCRSRRTPCTSQAFSDEPAPAAGRTAARLCRVESLVEQLAHQRGVEVPPPPSAEPAVPAAPEDPQAAAGATPPRPGRAADDDLAAVSRALLAVWPDDDDMELMLRVPTSLTIMTHGLVCAPYARVVSSAMAGGDDDENDDAAWSPRRLQLQPRPAPGTHPVLIARRLLLLAALLRGVPEAAAEALLGGGRLRVGYRAHMARAVDAARLVTADDGLAGGSLDGLECVLLEAMYLNNEGRLRRAWLANRRALALAQLWRMPARAPPALAPETRARVDPAYLWFRLVCSDRYLSLMLGLPQGAPAADAAFAAPAALAACGAPLERFERLYTVACGLVIERNRAARTDAAATRRVDALLRDAAALMPPAWWCAAPDAAALAGPGARRAFDESLRIMAHMALRHILVQLHLPYLLLPPATPGAHDYSRMVAVDACRAIVAQFLAFRALVPGTAYCRGLDFVAFIASTVLCLAHIEAHRLQQEDEEGGGDDGRYLGPPRLATAFQSLAHQRPGDRALLDRALACLDATAGTRDDAIARRAGGILGPLLTMEDRAACGGACYRARASDEAPPPPCTEGEGEEEEEEEEATHDRLRIEIPYFGTVQVERRPSAPALSAVVSVQQLGAPEDWESAGFGGLGSHAHFPELSFDDENAWALQGVDTALFTNLAYEPVGLGDNELRV